MIDEKLRNKIPLGIGVIGYPIFCDGCTDKHALIINGYVPYSEDCPDEGSYAVRDSYYPEGTFTIPESHIETNVFIVFFAE
ncbi:hypothetical protein ACFL6Y_07105 [Elusimicrobiota bacterium]